MGALRRSPLLAAAASAALVALLAAPALAADAPAGKAEPDAAAHLALVAGVVVLATLAVAGIGCAIAVLGAERVRAAVESLAPIYRLPVVLRYAQGLSLEEISEITGEPVATVKTHLHRARAALKGLLEAPPARPETRPPRPGTQ